MKMTFRVATILTWFNIIFWGFIDGVTILGSLVSFNLLSLGSAVLMSAVPLHCYAALKLYKSIRQPELPLSHQTPVGIRFVGFMALFLGIYSVANGFEIISDPKALADLFNESLMQKMPDFYKQFPQYKNIGGSVAHASGVITVILGLFIAINVLLNLRLLRWYLLLRKNDAS